MDPSSRPVPCVPVAVAPAIDWAHVAPMFTRARPDADEMVGLGVGVGVGMGMDMGVGVSLCARASMCVSTFSLKRRIEIT